jgi:DNA-binding NtrC family response regulator
VRLISATHLPLQRYVRSEHFRQDLFYRISGITISLPPLRERPNDLRALLGAEITTAAREQRKTITGLSRTAADRLFAHSWPGNLRELKRVIQTAVALTDGTTIQPDGLLLDATAIVPSDDQAGRNGESILLSQVVASQAANDVDALRLDIVERRHIDHVLHLTGGNKRRAARLLGLSRSTLDRKLAGTAGDAATDVAVHDHIPPLAPPS